MNTELTDQEKKIESYETRLRELHERAVDIEREADDEGNLPARLEWELKQINNERAERVAHLIEPINTPEGGFKFGTDDDGYGATFAYRYRVLSPLVDKYDIRRYARDYHYEPNQVRSAYDCTGQGFVSSTDIYYHSYYDAEDTEYFKQIIILEHWGVDI